MHEAIDRHGNRSPAEENFHAMPLDRPKVMPHSLKSHWH
jgi:hypothetical protein